MLFQLEHVNYFYPGKIEALKDINFSVDNGEQISILGANGCGKSTLLKIMAGLIFPSKGTIKVFDRIINDKLLNTEQDLNYVRKFRSSIGILFQDSDTQLFCPTVFDEIAFGPLQLDLPKDEIKSRIDDILSMLEIQHLKKRAPYTLSGGEKKRVAIASVLSLNPSVLLLDEPTSGLDPRTQSWLEELLHSLGKTGKTIILATHDLDIADAISEKAIVFNETHQIQVIGSTQEILENHDMLKQVNLIHEHYHRHGEFWHKHEEESFKHSH